MDGQSNNDDDIDIIESSLNSMDYSPIQNSNDSRKMDISPLTPCKLPTLDRPPKYYGQIQTEFGYLRSIEEIPSKYRQLFSQYPFFNRVQSEVMDDVLYTDSSLIVSAPTASGKTTIFELAIIRLMLLMEDMNYTDDFKIIYIAPVKALCTERLCDWHKKFSELGLSCIEVTGDTERLEFKNLENYQIIITTPEKWDSITRKWKENRTIVQVVKLFLIDEIHLLNDKKRGPTLEAIVSRMKTIQKTLEYELNRESQDELNQNRVVIDFLTQIRFVATSATINNIEDIGDWLRTERNRTITRKFGEEYRPVALNKVVLGYSCPENSSPYKFDIMLNYKLSSIIQQYSNNKPTLVFCTTRKGIYPTAEILAKSLTFKFTTEQTQHITQLSSQITDSKLRQKISVGIGWHHAGIQSEDRTIIETLFKSGLLPVLLTTSTLSMGVNLPAHLVIIKSTEVYENGGFQHCNEIVLQQMIGRAGRPQYDTFATAVIMTKSSMKKFYEDMITGTELIESNLHKHLGEHLNSEVVLRTITDLIVAMDWLKTTFLYTRVLKNPKHYNFQPQWTKNKIEDKLIEMCQIEINKLKNLKLVETTDEMGLNLKPTRNGELMAQYHLSFETIKLFLQLQGHESLFQLLTMICESDEFSDVYLRVNDKKVLNTLNKSKFVDTIRFQLPGKINNSAMKVNCLIQAVFGSLTISDISLKIETENIMRTGERICNCLCQYLREKPRSFIALKNALTLAKCFNARLWENSLYVTQQLPKIGPVTARLLVTAQITTFDDVLKSNPRNLERVMNRGPPLGNTIMEYVQHIPQYSLIINLPDFAISPPRYIAITIKILNFREIGILNTLGKNHMVHLLIGDNENNVLFYKKICDEEILLNGSITKQVQLHLNYEHEVFGHIISETWVGVDVEISKKMPQISKYLINTAKKAGLTGNKSIRDYLQSDINDIRQKSNENSETIESTVIENKGQEYLDQNSEIFSEEIDNNSKTTTEMPEISNQHNLIQNIQTDRTEKLDETPNREEIETKTESQQLADVMNSKLYELWSRESSDSYSLYSSGEFLNDLNVGVEDLAIKNDKDSFESQSLTNEKDNVMTKIASQKCSDRNNVQTTSCSPIQLLTSSESPTNKSPLAKKQKISNSNEIINYSMPNQSLPRQLLVANNTSINVNSNNCKTFTQNLIPLPKTKNSLEVDGHYMDIPNNKPKIPDSNPNRTTNYSTLNQLFPCQSALVNSTNINVNPKNSKTFTPDLVSLPEVDDHFMEVPNNKMIENDLYNNEQLVSKKNITNRFSASNNLPDFGTLANRNNISLNRSSLPQNKNLFDTDNHFMETVDNNHLHGKQTTDEYLFSSNSLRYDQKFPKPSISSYPTYSNLSNFETSDERVKNQNNFKIDVRRKFNFKKDNFERIHESENQVNPFFTLPNAEAHNNFITSTSIPDHIRSQGYSNVLENTVENNKNTLLFPENQLINKVGEIKYFAYTPKKQFPPSPMNNKNLNANNNKPQILHIEKVQYPLPIFNDMANKTNDITSDYFDVSKSVSWRSPLTSVKNISATSSSSSSSVYSPMVYGNKENKRGTIFNNINAGNTPNKASSPSPNRNNIDLSNRKTDYFSNKESKRDFKDNLQGTVVETIVLKRKKHEVDEVWIKRKLHRCNSTMDIGLEAMEKSKQENSFKKGNSSENIFMKRQQDFSTPVKTFSTRESSHKRHTSPQSSNVKDILYQLSDHGARETKRLSQTSKNRNVTYAKLSDLDREERLKKKLSHFSKKSNISSTNKSKSNCNSYEFNKISRHNSTEKLHQFSQQTQSNTAEECQLKNVNYKRCATKTYKKNNTPCLDLKSQENQKYLNEFYASLPFNKLSILEKKAESDSVHYDEKYPVGNSLSNLNQNSNNPSNYELKTPVKKVFGCNSRNICNLQTRSSTPLHSLETKSQIQQESSNKYQTMNHNQNYFQTNQKENILPFQQYTNLNRKSVFSNENDNIPKYYSLSNNISNPNVHEYSRSNLGLSENRNFARSYNANTSYNRNNNVVNSHLPKPNPTPNNDNENKFRSDTFSAPFQSFYN